VVQGVPGRLRPQTFLTFRHYKGGRSSAILTDIYRSHKYEKILEILIQVMPKMLRMFNYSVLFSYPCQRNSSWFYEFLTHSAVL